MNNKTVNIGGRCVGEGQPVFIIAEVSANHRGKIETALSAIDIAADAGADAVKFQHLTHNKIAAEPLSDFYKSAELPDGWTEKLVERSKKKNIFFLSTPFDLEAVDLLDEIGVPAFKVASYEMTDDVLLRHISRKGKPIILSTGMAYLEEVKHAINVIKQEDNEQVIALHCVSLYPPEFRDLNLRVIETMRRELGCPIGYSDHANPSSNVATLGAIALGACVIERHITDSQEGGSNDDKNSMTPEQLKQMVIEIRDLSAALSGAGVKAPVSDPGRGVDEIRERSTRRSLYAVRDIVEGEAMSADMIVTLRPMKGIEPKDFQQVMGRKTLRAISARSPITWQDIER
ncbi:N-acetylneuraminate synthase family protein [Candidatus Nomurabacteria bacterium]|nr:N-acetylneuraminate synthase family protein [Candidatus Nomurabacteria bacterium]